MTKQQTNSYALTEKQVEALAHDTFEAQGRLTGNNNTYLRVLLTACQAQLGAPSRRRAIALDAQVSVLEQAHAKYYAAVLRGVSTPDIAVDDATPADEALLHNRERQRRATFARSAASTLRAFVNAGGDLRGVDVQTCTKAVLREAIHAGQDEAQLEQRSIERAQGALLRIFSHRAREHPDEARAGLEAVIDMLQTALENMGDVPDHADSTTSLSATGVHRAMASSRVMPAPSQLHRGA